MTSTLEEPQLRPLLLVRALELGGVFKRDMDGKTTSNEELEEELCGHRPPSSRRAGIYSPAALLPLAHQYGMTPLVRGRSASPRRSSIRSPQFHPWIERDAPGVSIEPIIRGGTRSQWLLPVNDVFSPQTPSSTERLTSNGVLQRNTPLLFVSPSTPMLDWATSPPAHSSNTADPRACIASTPDNVTDALTSVDVRPEVADGGAAFAPSINSAIGSQVSHKAAQQLTCNPLNLFVPSAGDSLLHDGAVNLPLIPCDILPIVSNANIDCAQDEMASDSDNMEELVVTVHLARNLSLSPCRAILLPPPVSPTRSTFSLSDISTEGTAVGRNQTSVNDLNGLNPVYNKNVFTYPAPERAPGEQRVTDSPRRLKKRAPTVVLPHEVRPRCSSLSTSISDHTDALTKKEKDRSSGFATRRFAKHISRFGKRKEECSDFDIVGPEQPASLRSKNGPRQSKPVLRESFDEFEWPFKEQRGRIGNQDVVIVQRRTYVKVEEISRVRPTRLKMRRSLESL